MRRYSAWETVPLHYINWWIDWVIHDWLIDWLIVWLIRSFVRLFVHWLIHWLIDWLIDWLTVACYFVQKKMAEMLKQIEEEKSQIVRLGDASIASPFTSKLSTTQCGRWIHWSDFVLPTFTQVQNFICCAQPLGTNLRVFGPGRRVPKSHFCSSSASSCCWNPFFKGPKIPKTFLICSVMQQNFAHIFVLTLPIDLPSQIFHIFSN